MATQFRSSVFSLLLVLLIAISKTQHQKSLLWNYFFPALENQNYDFFNNFLYKPQTPESIIFYRHMPTCGKYVRFDSSNFLILNEVSLIAIFKTTFEEKKTIIKVLMLKL